MALSRVLLALGVVVVAPLCLRLLGGRWRTAVGLGSLAAVGLALPAGPLAAGLGVPWLGLAMASVVADLPRAWRAGRAAGGVGADAFGPLVDAVAPLAARVWWVVGAGWLLLDRLALDPIGVGEGLVLLTAVHFHFAGLAATTITSQTVRRVGPRARPALIGSLAAPPIVAIGFVALPVMQVVGAVVFTAALLWWAAVAGRLPGRAGVAWLVARGAVLLSMPLATWWAIGWVTGLPAPSIPLMAATHGVANAVGFSLCGAAALLATAPAAPHAPLPTPTSQPTAS